MVHIQEIDQGIEAALAPAAQQPSISTGVPVRPLLEMTGDELVQTVTTQLDGVRLESSGRGVTEEQRREALSLSLLEELRAVLAASSTALDEAETSLKTGLGGIDGDDFSRRVQKAAETSGAVQEAAIKIGGGRDGGLAERAFNCRRRALRLLDRAPAIAGPRCWSACPLEAGAEARGVANSASSLPATASAQEAGRGPVRDDMEARRSETWAGVTHLGSALLEVNSRLLENNGQGGDALALHKLVREIIRCCDALQRRGERLAAERFALAKGQAPSRRSNRGLGVKAAGGGEWSLTQTFRVGTRGSEQGLAGRAVLLEASSCSSVAQACEGLNRGSLECPDGVCIVYSAQAKAYYAIYRQGCRELAHSRLPALQEVACPPASMELTTLNARLKETRRGAERLLETLKRGTEEPAAGWFQLPGCCAARGFQRR